MSAKCYWCVDTASKVGKITNHIGGVNEPVGVCSVCQILTCGHHGLRDNATDTFICVDCDLYGICHKVLGTTATIGGSSSGGDEEADQAARRAVEAVLGRRFRSPYNIPWRLTEQPAYTLEDLKRDRPQYSDWLTNVSLALVDERLWPELSVSEQFQQSGSEKKLILIAVALIARHIYPTGNLPVDLPEIIRELSRHILVDDDPSFKQIPTGEL